MFSKLNLLFDWLLENVLKKYIVTGLMKVLGLAAGGWAWLIGIGVGFFINFIEKFAKKEAASADEKIKEDGLSDALHKAQQGSDKDAENKAALDVLNG